MGLKVVENTKYKAVALPCTYTTTFTTRSKHKKSSKSIREVYIASMWDDGVSIFILISHNHVFFNYGKFVYIILDESLLVNHGSLKIFLFFLQLTDTSK